MIENKIHKSLMDNAFTRYKFQDRSLGKEIFPKIEEFLINSIELYPNIYFLDENDPKSKQICTCFRYNKKEILSFLKQNYQDQLFLLKNMGGDISDYPNDLEELIK